MRIRWGRAAALAVLILTAVVLIVYSHSLASRARVGDPAPDFTLAAPDGREFRLSQARGRVVLLNFWATWCDPCREEAPFLQTFSQRYGDRVQLLGINLREPPDRVDPFRDAFGISYPLLLDRNAAVSDRYGVRGIPESWFLDEEGVARLHHVGTLRFEDIQQAFRMVTGRSIDADGIGPVEAGQTVIVAAGLGDAWFLSTGPLFRGNVQQAGWQPVTSGPSQDGPHAGGSDPAGEDLRGGDPAWVDLVPLPQEGAVYGLDRSGQVWRVDVAGDQGAARAVGSPVPWDDGGDAPFPPALAVLRDDEGPPRFVVSRGVELWRSADGGNVWEPLAEAPTAVRALAVDPHTPDRLLAAWPLGLLESRDGGDRWHALPLRAENPDPDGRMPWDPDVPPTLYDLVVSPQREGRVYLATDHGIWVSDDGGATLAFAGTSPARILVSVTAEATGARNGAERVLAAAPNGDLYLSRDGAGTWARIPLRPQAGGAS